MSRLNRRSYLSLVAGTSAISYGAYRYANRWNPDDCDVDGTETSAEAPTGGSFTTYHGDAGHTGHVKTEAGSNSGTEYWRCDLGEMPDSSGGMTAVVANDHVYACGWALYALDQATGSLTWCVNPGPRSTTSPVVAGDTVLVGTEFDSGTGGVAAFDAADGTRRWRAPARGLLSPTIGVPTQAPVVRDDAVYVASGQDTPRVSAIDLSTGEIRWRTKLEDGRQRPHALALGADGLFVLQERFLSRVDPEDGGVVWQTEVGDGDGSPAVAGGLVVARAGEQAVAAWDAKTGERRWAYTEVAGAPSSVCLVGETVYAVTGHGVHVLDALTGELVWKKTGPEAEECLVTDDTLYLGLESGLAALDPDDGMRRWYVWLPGGNDRDAVYPGRPGGPAVAADTLFVLTEAGRVHAVGA